MNVVISPHIKKTSERIDEFGNVINPMNRQILKPIEKEEVFENPQPKVEVVKRETSPLTIQEQIEEAKRNLAQLEELKQLKIKEMEAQLELLKQ